MHTSVTSIRTKSSRPIEIVIGQHAEDAIVLRNVRSRLVRAAHVKLHHLGRLDDRLDAHLDGLAVSGAAAWAMFESALDAPDGGTLFAAGVCAIQARLGGPLERLLALAEAVPEVQSALTSAFGWVSREAARQVTEPLLSSPHTFRKCTGIAARVMHRDNEGLDLAAALASPHCGLRAQALLAAGQLGRRDLLGPVCSNLNDEDQRCRVGAAWSGLVLGDRHRALHALTAAVLGAGAFQGAAFRALLPALPVASGHGILRGLPEGPGRLRLLVEGSAFVGDPAYVSWLIKQMEDESTARLAGDSFSTITGADLALFDLERNPSANFESGPNDDPDDPNVDMDPDEGLPWPDPDRVKYWWAKNSSRFQPGQRYFMGAPVTREHCIDVLKNGYQRQRILAAHYLCLLNPGTPLFNTSAPAWRQQKLLAEMK